MKESLEVVNNLIFDLLDLTQYKVREKQLLSRVPTYCSKSIQSLSKFVHRQTKDDNKVSEPHIEQPR